jgi:arylsulfate sulfotransferase
VDDDFVMEIDANRNLVKAWNLAEIVKRYLPAEQDMVVEGEDWLHVNSVEYKEEDDALIISARQQFGVFKLDYTSGDIMWILNDTSSRWFSYPALKKLALIPEEGCELPLGQHTPVFIGEDEMLLMDNGYDGYGQSGDSGGLTDGGKGYSRLVIYKINEEEGRVTQEFQYGKERGRELYSKFAGNAGHLPSRDILFALFGNMVSEDGEHNTARYIEFDGNGSIIFEAMLESENASRFFFRASKIDMQMLINNYYL